MMTAEYLEAGHLLLPPEITKKLDLQPGGLVGVDADRDGTIRLYPRVLDIDDVCGMLKAPAGRHLTVEEMDEAAAEGFRRG